MSEDIPNDVMDAALAAIGNVGWIESIGPEPLEARVARAIMAERERCFKAVLHLKDSGRKNLVFRSDALAAIHKGEA